jgi:hypothetical protein
MSDGKKAKTNFWWPQISTIEGAKRAAQGGATAALIVALVTLAFTLYAVYQSPILNLSAWSFADVVIFLAIAFGIWRLSRTAAILGLAFYLAEQATQWASSAPKNPVMTVLFILYFTHGIRGTFAIHKLKRSAAQAQLAVQPEVPEKPGHSG